MRPMTSWPPSTTPGCRADRWRAATHRHPERPHPARRRGTAPTTPARRSSAASASHSANSPGVDVPLPHTGWTCCCGVELQAGVVHAAVEVDRELWNARDRPVHVDEVRRAVAGQDPPGDAEVAVEPRVEEHTAVDLDAELTPARRIGVGVRLHAQAGRVGVGADQTERGVGTVVGAAGPRRSARRRGR